MNTKAILVIDIPDDWHCKEWCIEGDLMGKNEDGEWIFCNEIVEAPLKPLPKKEEYANGHAILANKLWNKVVDAVVDGKRWGGEEQQKR